MKPNALIIEDNRDDVRLLELQLKPNGWEYEWVNNVPEGVARATKHPFPEITLLDLTLPGSLPWETASYIPDLLKNGPVLVLSSFDDTRLVEAVKTLGAHFCLKDYTRTRIFESITAAIEAYKTTPYAPRRSVDQSALALLNLHALFSNAAPSTT